MWGRWRLWNRARLGKPAAAGAYGWCSYIIDVHLEDLVVRFDFDVIFLFLLTLEQVRDRASFRHDFPSRRAR
jgi:hypothetical protein